MKTKIVYLLVAVMGVFMVTSCDHNNPNSGKYGANPQLGYVHFIGTAPSITSATDTIFLTIENSTFVPDGNPLTVTYGVEPDTASTSQVDPNTFFDLSTTSVTLAADQSTATIALPINKDVQADVLASGLQIRFFVVLTGTDDPDVLANDQVASVGLTYPCSVEVSSSYTDQISAPDIGYSESDFPAFTVHLTQISGLIYSADDIWGPDMVSVLTGSDSYYGQFPLPVTLIIDPSTFAVDVIPGGDGSLASGGEGTYNPCKDTWSLDIHQTVFSGGPFDIHVNMFN